MLSIPLYDKTGKKAGKVEIDEKLLGTKVRRRLLAEAVKMYEANKRQGTHSTKERCAVAGARRKMYRQKGTGHSRAGYRQSPLRRGGGVIFGPSPRDYSYSINKKGRREALKSALLAKIIDKEIVAVTDLELDSPKTGGMAGLLKKLGVEGKCLIGTKGGYRNLFLATRNLPGVEVVNMTDFNAYDVIKHDSIIVEESAFADYRAKLVEAAEVGGE